MCRKNRRLPLRLQPITAPPCAPLAVSFQSSTLKKASNLTSDHTCIRSGDVSATAGSTKSMRLTISSRSAR